MKLDLLFLARTSKLFPLNQIIFLVVTDVTQFRASSRFLNCLFSETRALPLLVPAENKSPAQWSSSIIDSNLKKVWTTG